MDNDPNISEKKSIGGSRTYNQNNQYNNYDEE